jgi:hypothetical protein
MLKQMKRSPLLSTQDKCDENVKGLKLLLYFMSIRLYQPSESSCIKHNNQLSSWSWVLLQQPPVMHFLPTSCHVIRPPPKYFPPITYMRSSSSPFVLHAPPISSSSAWLFYTWRRVQIAKLFIMQFSSLSSYFIPLRSKYLPQHLVLRYPQSKFHP